MKNEPRTIAHLNDAELVREIHTLIGRERASTAQLIAAIGELDARRLYLSEGCSSLFTYCTQVLHLSEHAAYGRIEAARAARKWPVVLELLETGELHLTAVGLLSRHLTSENHKGVLAAACHRSKREIEELVAALHPQPDVPALVRKLPAVKPAPAEAGADAAVPAVGSASVAAVAGPRPESVAERQSEVRPLAPERYKVQFTLSRETHQRLREVQELLRHRVPSGDVGEIFDRALTLLLGELRRTRHAAVDRPRASSAAKPAAEKSRYIPAAVKRTVWDRDQGRCAFVGRTGRCTERGFLEYHHVVPFGDGGETSVGTWSCDAAPITAMKRRGGLGLLKRILFVRRGRSLVDHSTAPEPRLARRLAIEGLPGPL